MDVQIQCQSDLTTKVAQYLQLWHADHLCQIGMLEIQDSFTPTNLFQDQVVYLAFAILGFAVPQTSQIGAKCCRSSYSAMR